MKILLFPIMRMFMARMPLLTPASADVPPSEKPEVEYLLGLVKSSPCKFERNGKLYDGGEAYGHIKKKYEHFRNQITSTEGFIEYAATKSMISGEYYFIICPGSEPEKTGDWLLRELGKYRETR
jgi:hypothetical protein